MERVLGNRRRKERMIGIRIRRRRVENRWNRLVLAEMVCIREGGMTQRLCNVLLMTFRGVEAV